MRQRFPPPDGNHVGSAKSPAAQTMSESSMVTVSQVSISHLPLVVGPKSLNHKAPELFF